MGFLGTTDTFSPCALTPLPRMISLIKTPMPKFLISLEPKADWDRTHEYPLLKDPATLLKETLRVVSHANLQLDKCTIYVDANKVQPKEEFFLEQISDYCSLAFAVRRFEGHDAQLAMEKKKYDWIMPTIEFHPTHPNYGETTGVESLKRVQFSVPKAIYWIVDTPIDLERVALFKGSGVVSNRPLEMVKMLTDRSYGWCSRAAPPTQAERRRERRI